MTDHIKFCNVCENKKWNLQTGILCSLTDKKPDFKNNCQDYKYSIANYRKLIEDKKDTYKRLYSRELAGSNSRTECEFTQKIENHRVTSAHMLPDKIELFHSFPFNIIFKKPIMTIDNIGIQGKIVRIDGFKFNREKVEIKWNEIICTSFQTVWEKKDNQQTKYELFVVDGISDKISISFPYNFNMNKKELGHYIELFKEKNNVAQHGV